MIQVSTLLYRVAEHADGRTSLEDIAGQVTARVGRPVSAANVRFLLERKLLPLGLLATGDGATAAAPRADLLLGVRVYRDAIPEWLVNRFAAALSPLFRPVVVALVLVSLAAFDFWLVAVHGLRGSVTELIARPAWFLLVFAILVASTVFHELGHAAACRYGGARPGAIGGGLYILWPVLYTEVTDAYRLNRAGRLRTDVGGIYFNGVAVLAVAAGYAATSFEPLLIAVLLIHVSVVQQLLPIFRLDGYFILADLVGVPDLFGRVKPTLRSLLPKHRTDPGVRGLRRSARVVITVWVLLVIPFLLLTLALLVIHLPSTAAAAAASFRTYIQTAAVGVEAGDVPAVVAAAINIGMLALTSAATAYLLALLAWRATRGTLRTAKTIAAATWARRRRGSVRRPARHRRPVRT